MLNTKLYPPSFILSWRVILLLLYHSEFYANNYELLDDIDTFFLILFVLHFLYNIKKYFKKYIIFGLYIVSFLQLFILGEFITQNQYLLIYTSLIMTTIGLSIKNKYVLKRH